MSNAADRVHDELFAGVSSPTDLEQAFLKLVLLTLSAGYSGSDLYANPAREVVRRLVAASAVGGPPGGPAMAFITHTLYDVGQRFDKLGLGNFV